MHLDRGATEPVAEQIRRAQGRLAVVVRMLQDGRECEDVVAELAAVTKALDRAGFAVVTSGLQQCNAAEDPGGAETRKLEKLFLSLA